LTGSSLNRYQSQSGERLFDVPEYRFILGTIVSFDTSLLSSLRLVLIPTTGMPIIATQHP
jgi:hypothetical protein